MVPIRPPEPHALGMLGLSQWVFLANIAYHPLVACNTHRVVSYKDAFIRTKKRAMTKFPLADSRNADQVTAIIVDLLLGFPFHSTTSTV